VYAELAPTSLELFVRDTGRGFDAGNVPSDRRGLSESIVGRMQRAGGQASIRSQPGAGTEVALTMPRRVA
jgi:signal transduction histidine kinase